MKKFGWIKTKKQQRGILSTLKKIRKFIEKPERWGKEDFEIHNEDDTTSYCVIGASKQVDGPYEWEADKAIALSLSGAYKMKRYQEEELLNMEEADDDALEPVFFFNDDPKTKHRQVLALLDRAYSNIEKAL